MDGVLYTLQVKLILKQHPETTDTTVQVTSHCKYQRIQGLLKILSPIYDVMRDTWRIRWGPTMDWNKLVQNVWWKLLSNYFLN